MFENTSCIFFNQMVDTCGLDFYVVLPYCYFPSCPSLALFLIQFLHNSISIIFALVELRKCVTLGQPECLAINSNIFQISWIKTLQSAAVKLLI